MPAGPSSHAARSASSTKPISNASIAVAPGAGSSGFGSDVLSRFGSITIDYTDHLVTLG